jgi:hypothetical protein
MYRTQNWLLAIQSKHIQIAQFLDCQQLKLHAIALVDARETSISDNNHS